MCCCYIYASAQHNYGLNFVFITKQIWMFVMLIILFQTFAKRKYYVTTKCTQSCYDEQTQSRFSCRITFLLHNLCPRFNSRLFYDSRQNTNVVNICSEKQKRIKVECTFVMKSLISKYQKERLLYHHLEVFITFSIRSQAVKPKSNHVLQGATKTDFIVAQTFQNLILKNDINRRFSRMLVRNQLHSILAFNISLIHK